MGYEVDTEQMFALSEDIGQTALGLRAVSRQVGQIVVQATGFGGDRYQDHGAAYVAANRDLADLAGALANQVDWISGLLLETTGAYRGAEAGAEGHVNSSGAGLRGDGGA